MEKSCVSCRKPETASSCGICEGALCRKCRLFLGDEAFPFMAEVPAELKHAFYCGLCFDEHVAPAQENYESTLEQAKSVNVIYKHSKSTLRCLRKAEQAYSVSGSKDRDDAILWLAFQAAKAGYNTIIDVEVSSKKVRNEGWQSTVWAGVGTPADIRSHQTDRMD